MAQLHPYDEEGKERVRHIAKYVLGFVENEGVELPASDEDMQWIGEIVQSCVTSDDYLMDEYGYSKAEQLVYNEMERL